jgi:hypothetical protein
METTEALVGTIESRGATVKGKEFETKAGLPDFPDDFLRTVGWDALNTMDISGNTM